MNQEPSITIVIFIVCGLFALNALSYYAGKIKLLPDIIWVLLLGIIYGYAASTRSLDLPIVRLNENIVFYGFIPLLIFASTQKVCLHHLKQVLLPASIVASAGIIVSMFIIGLGIHYLFDIPWLLALLFGVVVSATDPLAISALLSSNTSIKESIKLLIEGESILNDGFVVTVFGLLFALNFEGQEFSWSHACLDLLKHIIGATVLGIAIARGARAVLSAWSEEHFILTTNMTLVVAYSSFLLAESLHFSGIIAVFAAALAYGYKPQKNEHENHTQRHLWEYFEYIANACLFFMLGASVMEFSAFSNLGWNTVLFTILLVFVARSVALASLWPITKVEQQRLSMKNYWLLNFAGARGAVSIALLLLLPDDLIYKQFFLTIAFIMILFTLIVYPLLMQRTLKAS